MLTQRAYAGDRDQAAVMGLWIAARAAAGCDPWPSLDSVWARLAAAPGGAADVQIWEGRGGELIGAALLLDESIMVWCTQAGAEDEALELEMVRWGREAVARASDRSGERSGLFIPVIDGDERLSALLGREGFAEDGWRTLRMARQLCEPVAAPAQVDGVVVRPVAGPGDIAAVTALHNRLFAGGRKTGEERAAIMGGPGYRGGLDLVAELPGGELAGYALGVCGEIERRLGQALGWVEFVGVAHGQRGRGIGRALALQLLAALRREGVELALLTTGGANVAARRLFESCGFRVRHTIRWYVSEEGRHG